MTKMSSAEQRKEREQNVRQQITRKLVETGEREKLKELLRYVKNKDSKSIITQLVCQSIN